MFIHKVRHIITLKAAFLVFILIFLATIIRPIIIEQSIIFTYFGIVNSLIMGSLYFYLKKAKPREWHAIIFVLAGMFILVPIVVISGGSNSQFAFLFSIMPLFVSLVSTAKNTWIMTVFIIFCLLVIHFTAELVPDFTYEEVSKSKSVARTIWLSFSVLLGCKFGIEFNRIVSTLGNKLSKQAEIDALTGILNRGSIMAFLQHAIEEAQQQNGSLSVLMIDLDHFKHINDKYGHLAGDNCLKLSAQCIKNCIRKHNDQVGRYGGEEFIVVIKDVEATKALEIAQLILTSLQNTPINIGQNEPIHLTATIGLCTLDGVQLTTIEHLISSADRALYEGKKHGRNRITVAK